MGSRRTLGMSDELGGTTPMIPGALSVVGEPVVAGSGADEAARLVGVWGRAEVEAGRPKRLWGRWGAKSQCWDDALGGSGSG